MSLQSIHETRRRRDPEGGIAALSRGPRDSRSVPVYRSMITQTPAEDPQSTGANPRRDAWFAIRGFYYQIQTTVQRWIHLASADVLQCESAEDIEVIRNAFVDGEPRVEWILEQVKVRETLTLRSEPVVSTVV